MTAVERKVHLEKYINQIVKKETNGFMLVGKAGMGKLNVLLSLLNKKEMPFKLCSGRITMIDVYKFLHQNNGDEVIIFYLDGGLKENEKLTHMFFHLTEERGNRSPLHMIHPDQNIPMKITPQNPVIFVLSDHEKSFGNCFSRLPMCFY